jgi:hypothetical protein
MWGDVNFHALSIFLRFFCLAVNVQLLISPNMLDSTAGCMFFGIWGHLKFHALWILIES